MRERGGVCLCGWMGEEEGRNEEWEGEELREGGREGGREVEGGNKEERKRTSFQQINFLSTPLELAKPRSVAMAMAAAERRSLMHYASGLIANPETNDFGLVNSRGSIHLRQTE